MTSLAARLSPLTGAASVLLLVVALMFEGTPPAADAATGEVVRYYADNRVRLLIGTVFAGLSAALLAWFGGSMYAAFRIAAGGATQLGPIALSGFVIASVGHTLLFGFVLAAAETVGAVSSAVTVTLGVLAALFTVPLAVGMLVAMLSSAVAILRLRALPRWVGYLTIVLAAAAAAATVFGAYAAVMAWVVASMLWIALLSIVASLHGATKPRSDHRSGGAFG